MAIRWDTTRPGRITGETMRTALLLSRAVHGRDPVRVLVNPTERVAAEKAIGEVNEPLPLNVAPFAPLPVDVAPGVLKGEIWLEVARE